MVGTLRFAHPTSITKMPKRDLNAELQSLMTDAKAGAWARKTEFTKRTDGGWRRRVVRADGTVEKDEIIPPGASAQFARLIGVSLRTLQEWEQGRKRPSGPASALLRIVASNPEVVGGVAVIHETAQPRLR